MSLGTAALQNRQKLVFMTNLSDTKTYNVGEGELATSGTDLLVMGRALHKLQSTRKRFSKKVRDYLQKKSEIGQQTGRKEDLAQVADDIRRAKNANGKRIFTRTEWLTKLLVLFLSRDFLPYSTKFMMLSCLKLVSSTRRCTVCITFVR